MADDGPVLQQYRVPDELWKRIQPLIPPERPKPDGGRPRMDDRRAFDAILYVLRTGIQWKALPRSLGASSTVHDRFQEWREVGLFERLWIDALQQFDKTVGLDWRWQAMDGAMTKAPLGGEKRDRTPPTGENRAPSEAS